MNLFWWKMTKLCHEMKKNLFSFMAAKFQKTHLAWSTVQMRTIDDLPEDTCHEGDRVQTRYFPLKTHLICYSIKAGTLNIWINAESLWVQCPTFITPLSPGPPELPKHRETESGLPWDQICGVSRNNMQFLQTPLGVQQGHLILTANPGS